MGILLWFISTLMIMIAAVTSYFINLSQMLYYLMITLILWFTGTDITPVTSAQFDCFSLPYMALIVFTIEMLCDIEKGFDYFH